VGQSVILTADLYGNSIRYHGKVVGFGAGTGSAFSLLPAQNATGNWIKIVQRVPVRIALDPREVAANPLQIGLTMKSEVNVRNDSGVRLPQLASNNVAYSTDVFHSTDESADARVQAIIAENDSVVTRPEMQHRDGERRLAASAQPDRLASAKTPMVAPAMGLSAGAPIAASSGRHLQ